MIEIQVGQGAMPGNAVIATPTEVRPEIKRLMRLRPGDAPIIHADLFLADPATPASLHEAVAFLREHADVPLALKMGASDRLEHDLDVALDAGVDVIVIDGTEGATGNAPVTLSDHFGIPALHALCRASQHLRRRGREADVDLCISGGLREPGDFLKAYALGAKAVGLATVVMFAMAHPQITETFPFYPPTDLIFYRARPRIPLNVDMAADALVRFFESCRKEMEVALRTMGHRSVKDIGPGDLCALDPDIAAVAGVPFSGRRRKEPERWRASMQDTRARLAKRRPVRV